MFDYSAQELEDDEVTVVVNDDEKEEKRKHSTSSKISNTTVSDIPLVLIIFPQTK
jgi:hypothetical protein